MLRLVNCKFDLVIENSRRLLANSNASLAQHYQRYTGGAYGHNVAQSSVYNYEPTTSVSCLTPKEVDWQICRVKNIETSLASQHQMIRYKDIYECYLQRLRQLYEALNALSTSNASCTISQSHHLSSVSFHDKTYNVDELIKSIDRNLEFSCSMNKIDRHWSQGESSSNTFATSGNKQSLVSTNAEHLIFQHFKLVESSSKQLICSKSSETNLPDKNKDLKDGKGPSQAQLNAMQDHLVESFPKFLSDKHDYSIYTKDVEFSINWYPEKSYSTKGTVNYAIEVARFRLFVHLRLANIRMTLLKVTNDSEEGSIKVRWRIIGLPHSKALWKYFSTNGREAEDVAWLDGFSTFYLNAEGLITKHSLDRVVPENENVKEKPSMMEKLGIKLRMPLPT